MKKIAMLVSNPAIHDNRVIKQAESLAKLGYNVTLHCYGVGDASPNEIKNKVQYYRYETSTSNIMIIFSAIKAAISSKNILLGLPLISALTFAKTCLVALFLNFFLKITLAILNIGRIFNIDKSYKLRSIIFNKFSNAYYRILRDAIVPIMHILIFSTFYKALENDDYNVIHAHDLDTALTGAYFTKRKSAKLIYDAHELETDRDDRSSKTSRKLSRIHEQEVVRKSSHISTVSKQIALRIQSDYALHNVPFIILNSPKTVNLYGKISNDLKSDLNLTSNEFLSVYVGLLSSGRNLFTTIDAALHLPINHHIALIGPGSDKYVSDLQEYSKKLGIEKRIHIRKPVSQDILLEYISKCDVGLILSDLLCDSFKYAMPNKLFEMSFSGLPLVVSNLESIRDYVEKNNIGKVVEGDLIAENIAKTILEIEANYMTIRPSQEQIDNLKSKYGWETQELILKQIYEAL